MTNTVEKCIRALENMTIPSLLSQQLASAMKTVLGDALPEGFVPTVTPSQDLRFGDYQSNAAMMLAKQAHTNPRALATQVVEAWKFISGNLRNSRSRIYQLSCALRLFC